MTGSKLKKYHSLKEEMVNDDVKKEILLKNIFLRKLNKGACIILS